jgi:hypothetical protein
VFRNWERNYKLAKQYSLTSGIGIDEADRKKGITTMPAKLEHMCASYELWDQWFGSKQKYKPSNVQSNSREFILSEEEDVGEGNRNSEMLEGAVNDTDGGRDGQLDAVQIEDGGGDNEGADGGGDNEGADGGGDNEGADGGGDNEGARQLASSSSSAQSPRPGSILLLQSPRHAPVLASQQASPNGQPSPRQHAAVQRQQHIQQATAAAAAIANAVSASPSTSTKADKFDATYAAVQNKKIETMLAVEQSRCANAISLQSRDQLFQARLVSAQQQCKDEDAQAERRLRQRISYETNLTQLLVKDESGELANDFDRRIAAQLDREERRMQSQGSNARQMLAALLEGALQPQ